MQDKKHYLALEGSMDALVFPQGKGFWRVNASPSIRDLGEIIRDEEGTFTLIPDEGAALEGIAAGPYTSLEKAQQAIAEHLGGSCRVAPPRNFR